MEEEEEGRTEKEENEKQQVNQQTLLEEGLGALTEELEELEYTTSFYAWHKKREKKVAGIRFSFDTEQEFMASKASKEVDAVVRKLISKHGEEDPSVVSILKYWLEPYIYKALSWSKRAACL